MHRSGASHYGILVNNVQPTVGFGELTTRCGKNDFVDRNRAMQGTAMQRQRGNARL